MRMDGAVGKTGPASRGRILVVEDERVVARDLCKTLAEIGYEVGASARSAKEALEQAAAQRPDLVLMDIRIDGETDGIEAATMIKNHSRTPVVFLTASTDDATLERAFQTKPDGYLCKPFSRRSLRTAIEMALQRYHVESQLREANDLLAAQKCQLETRTNELGLLSEMGDALQLCDSVREVVAIVARFARHLFSQDCGALYLVERSGTEMGAVASWGQAETLSTFDLAACRALRSGHVHHVVPPDDELRCAHLEACPGTGSICVPMATHGASHGVLSLTFAMRAATTEPSFVKAKEQIATMAAQRISLTLTNLRIRDQLQRESILDGLTGLYSRRYMASALDRAIRLASRSDRVVSLLMIDVDHFKSVNDQFGHAAADKVLAEVAGLLLSRLRRYDVPARYGGDEMVVVLPDTGIEGGYLLAEQLRQSIDCLQVTYGGNVLPPITVSIGVAVYPANGMEADMILRAADLALYQAKALGRDCVVSAEPVTTIPDEDNDLSRLRRDEGKHPARTSQLEG